MGPAFIILEIKKIHILCNLRENLQNWVMISNIFYNVLLITFKRHYSSPVNVCQGRERQTVTHTGPEIRRQNLLCHHKYRNLPQAAISLHFVQCHKGNFCMDTNVAWSTAILFIWNEHFSFPWLIYTKSLYLLNLYIVFEHH